MLARIEALENDNAGLETIQVDDEDDEVSLDDDDQGQSLFSYFSSDWKRSVSINENAKIMMHSPYWSSLLYAYLSLSK